jgi:phage gpG-like protein
MKFEITGMTELGSYFATISANLNQRLKEAGEKAGAVVVQETKMNLSGRVLQTRSGRLKNSIAFKMLAASKGWITSVGSITDNVPYAAIHEFGGFAGRNRKVKIPERSYLRKALADKINEITVIFERIIKQVLKK